ncbi:MAG: dihydroxy-acid dehydratase [Bacteroidota bacterium]|nr:dihydroxy-acid dehydratase [Bacteroidota bacterium]MDP4248750.1 dihydroxy-acid dehydratase [Bacteroidota bacterium]
MHKLRSHHWFYAANELGIQHKGALRSAGINMDSYSGQPIIGIANTWSELNSCNMSLRQIAAEVKKGVYEAGGIPLEFPVTSLGEELMKPSAMLYRNLLSMEVEENIRSYPLDGIVLLGNCDKTVPGLLMGAASANIPAIQLNGGPKKAGVFKGQRLGSGTDLWKYWDDLRMGKITNAEWEQIGKELSCGFGSCNTMGSASTLNGMLEVLGMMPLGLSTLPVDGEERYAITQEAGKRIVEMVYEDWKPSDIMTLNNFRNAIRVCMALGGSTNSVIHLTAVAGRLNISLFPDEFEEIGRQTPCITDVQPSGKRLVDELHTAGGIPGVIRQLGAIIDLSARTYTGKKLEELLNNEAIDQEIIRPHDHPLSQAPTLAILKGNLAPRGSLIKVSAADPQLLIHTGMAVVFEGYADMLNRIDDPDLHVDPSSVLVLKYAGPKGVPGMPEWGMIPIPKKLKNLGITDMVRVSDSRMSGTSYGTVILHVTPEAALGGAFAVIRNGDFVQINIPKRQISLLVDDQTITERLKSWTVPASAHVRGYPALYEREILQADEGCDFDFLKPKNAEELKFVQPVVGRS